MYLNLIISCCLYYVIILTNSVNFQCDEADCEKVFLSEKKLLKHKKTHSKVCRVVRQTVFECPVKNSCNAEENCQKVFLVKAELVKHINEDHSADDAAYKLVYCIMISL